MGRVKIGEERRAQQEKRDAVAQERIAKFREARKPSVKRADWELACEIALEWLGHPTRLLGGRRVVDGSLPVEVLEALSAVQAMLVGEE